jgi:prolyl-tRNA synthetase
MAKETQEGLTVKKDTNFSDWYQQIIQKADLADYSKTKGFMVIRPNAFHIWEQIQLNFNKRLKSLGVRNAYFPLLIPESFFQLEAEHSQGFKPEVAWISNTEEGERLAIRPTSETVMYDSYSKWIRSHRDLPLRINQWANVVRWETKATRLFIRTREFLWQEGHCVYETEDECDTETKIYLEEYQKLCKDLLALPVMTGRKSDKEKFAGAHYTFSIEAIMPDGKALQMGTSHNLGQSFAKSFNIKYLDENSKENLPWQNSWGISTRLIGALTMTHGDDKGLVLPPKVAFSKVVLVPILFKDTEKKVLEKAKDITTKLKKYDIILDDRDHSPGWKFNEWELKGIPIRLELGPKDIEKNEVILVRRDNNEKTSVKIANLDTEIKDALESIHNNLLEKAKKLQKSKIVSISDFQEFTQALKANKVVKVPWCDTRECEENIKDKSDGAKSINRPFDQPKNLEKKCFHCSDPASGIWYFAKSY